MQTQLLLATAVFLASAALGQQRYASEDEVVRLQADLRNLEAELETADTAPGSLAGELAEEIQAIRDNVVYLDPTKMHHSLLHTP